jgi:hypothetical protein
LAQKKKSKEGKLKNDGLPGYFEKAGGSENVRRTVQKKSRFSFYSTRPKDDWMTAKPAKLSERDVACGDDGDYTSLHF